MSEERDICERLEIEDAIDRALGTDTGVLREAAATIRALRDEVERLKALVEQKQDAGGFW